MLTAIRYMHAASTDKCIAGLASPGLANVTGGRELASQDRDGVATPQDRPAFS